MLGNEEHFFEGAEKLLEIWFEETSNSNNDLRNITRESSMFVSKRRWILKTCGTTTPLKCLSQLIKLASVNGYNIVTDLFYSRKNFIRPEAQMTPHKGFTEEVSYLDTLFPNGRSYCLGSMNLECWYLYTFSRSDMKLSLGHMMDEFVESDPDQTIEILMQNLDQNAMSVFNKKNILSAFEATSTSGIDKILPNMHIDDFLFDPCGYSMNGINEKGEYMTIHITPENLFSYVSFETNVAMTNYRNLINQVINTFKPGKFIVTIYANKCSLAYETMKELEVEYSKESHWKRTDMQCCNFPSYNLLFAQYSYNGKNNCSM
ncbi:S-adenosylmethionine decarboxylase proenzyme isoform X2 [Drosophila obscura]|uniref:S-adenosylmethionine decarboxylase proenzyme isoform X2 n=1 Tax=Drosophila obscura TaxID=7282 RepID=UPI001BB173A4|nr:S-adenosylmethionine decarboxylase proenzyme isoform X2 [Drosophila obscura]